MNNIQYLKDNIDEVNQLIANAEDRAESGEQFLDAHLSTLNRHLADLKKQLIEAEETLALVG